MVSAPALELPRAIAEELVAHARAGLPDEACGSSPARTRRSRASTPRSTATPARTATPSSPTICCGSSRRSRTPTTRSSRSTTRTRSRRRSPRAPTSTRVLARRRLPHRLARDGRRRPQGLHHRRRQIARREPLLSTKLRPAPAPPRKPPRGPRPSSELRTKTRHATTARTAIHEDAPEGQRVGVGQSVRRTDALREVVLDARDEDRRGDGRADRAADLLARVDEADASPASLAAGRRRARRSRWGRRPTRCRRRRRRSPVAGRARSRRRRAAACTRHPERERIRPTVITGSTPSLVTMACATPAATTAVPAVARNVTRSGSPTSPAPPARRA